MPPIEAEQFAVDTRWLVRRAVRQWSVLRVGTTRHDCILSWRSSSLSRPEQRVFGVFWVCFFFLKHIYLFISFCFSVPDGWYLSRWAHMFRSVTCERFHVRPYRWFTADLLICGICSQSVAARHGVEYISTCGKRKRNFTPRKSIPSRISSVCVGLFSLSQIKVSTKLFVVLSWQLNEAQSASEARKNKSKIRARSSHLCIHATS